MNIEELKEKIGTESFDNICSLTFEAIAANEISSEDFLRCVGLEGDQMYELAYLAGCDVHSKSLMSVGEAVSRLRFYGSIENIHKKHPNLVSSEEVLEYNKLRASVWASASDGAFNRNRSRSL